MLEALISMLILYYLKLLVKKNYITHAIHCWCFHNVRRSWEWQILGVLVLIHQPIWDSEDFRIMEVFYIILIIIILPYFILYCIIFIKYVIFNKL